MVAFHVELADPDLPEFGLPEVEPIIPAEIFEQRLLTTKRRASAAGYEALLVYADREHFANMAYLTSYDPRFEEALLIIVPDREPTLLVGNEGMAYSYMCPYPVQRVLFQSFSLISQPRDASAPLKTILREAGLSAGQKIGIAGWKYYSREETEIPERWLEVPAYLVDGLRELGCDLYNAGELFMEPETGLRVINEAEQLAGFEYASTWGSQAVRDLLFNIRPGMTEFEAFQLMRLNGLPLGYHPLVQTGERTRFGLAGASSRKLKIGDPSLVALGPWGSNTARAGFLVQNADQLPESVQDYVEKLVLPYFQAIVEWYEHLAIGVGGGELYDIIHKYLGDPFFGVTLNPGHLIHLDEWVSSPIYKGSTQRLRSGMAIQVDVIPATGTAYHTTLIEDTIALADENLRQTFAQLFPQAWARIQKRRMFMEEVLGIRLKPEVLPFSNIPGYLPPFWLSPRRAMVAAR
jgi:hypothetical protein